MIFKFPCGQGCAMFFALGVVGVALAALLLIA